MSIASSIFANIPGQSSVVETYERAWSWGPAGGLMITGEVLASTCADPTNSPTYELRPGLLLGKIAATGELTNYSAVATNGSEVAYAVLPVSIRMQDIFTGANTQKFYKMIVGGRVQAANLIGLDLMARAQMSDRFYFDDNIVGNRWFPWRRFQTKLTDYTVTAADNFTRFDNLGAVGNVNFTLPALQNGLYFGFSAMTAVVTLTVTSAAGNDMFAFNDVAASTVAFQSAGAIIGGAFKIYSNPAGTAWIVETASAGANTVTVT